MQSHSLRLYRHLMVTARVRFARRRVWHLRDASSAFMRRSAAVSSVLAGQYVCIMAYGQTGAGKTGTMQGGDEQAAHT